MSLPKSAEHVIAAIMELTPEIRYAALASGQDVAMRQREDLEGASASDSDRFEELLVNPALLTLARQRGEIDCGGLRYLVVGYGSFDQLVLAWRDGHASIAFERGADPASHVEAIVEILAANA
jgi:hypothetical protein